MNEDELNHLIKGGESDRVEFTTTTDDNKKIKNGSTLARDISPLFDGTGDIV